MRPAITPEAEALIGRSFPIHEHGHVILLDIMGDDMTVVDAARTSITGGKQLTSDRGLIRYLMRHHHDTPFEMPVLRFHIRAPIFVERQWFRHRTASINSVSQRYSEVPEEHYLPQTIETQSRDNRQGRGMQVNENLEEMILLQMGLDQATIYEHYHQYLQEGVAKELARINLPLSLFTEWVWQCNLRNLFHFLGLRLEAHAQKEIRDYAEPIAAIVNAAFPWCWEAFVDYHLEARTFSRQELRVIRANLGSTAPYRPEGVSKREWAAFCLDLEVVNREVEGKGDA